MRDDQGSRAFFSMNFSSCATSKSGRTRPSGGFQGRSERLLRDPAHALIGDGIGKHIDLVESVTLLFQPSTASMHQGHHGLM